MNTSVALVLLSLCLVPGTRAAASADVRDEASRWVAGALNHPEKCRVQCDGDSMCGGAKRAPSDGQIKLLSELPDNYECWGLFKMWCGGPPSGEGVNRTEEISGSACQGHYKTMNYTKDDKPGTTNVVIVCEGGLSWVSRRTSTCPYTMKTYKKMMGVMNVGTSMSSMSYPERKDGGSDAPASLTPSAFDKVSVSSSAEAAAAPILRELDESVALIADAAEQDHHHVHLKGNDTDMFTLIARSHGLSVSWRATKQVPADDCAQSEPGWGGLEADAKDILGTSWSDWLPGGGSHTGDVRHDDRPALMCNNKPAWLHGALPCWGNFSVSATRTESAKPCTSKSTVSTGARAGTHSRSLRAGQATLLRVNAFNGRTAMKPVSELATSDVKAGWSSSMHAECDGLWTGLMKNCIGVSTSHATVMNGEDLHMSKRMICSGRQSLRFIKRTNAFGMAVSCKGQSVTALQAAIHHST